LEDFAVGDIYCHPLGRTIVEADNVWFTALTMNSNQLYFNSHYSKGGLYGRSLVNSTITLAVVTRVSVSDVSQHAVANLGWDEVRLVKPVFVGDTLYAQSRIDMLRPSASHPEAGIVGLTTRRLNQDGEVVITFKRTVMVSRRGHEGQSFPEPKIPWNPAESAVFAGNLERR
jgi:acyl dehydratase